VSPEGSINLYFNINILRGFYLAQRPTLPSTFGIVSLNKPTARITKDATKIKTAFEDILDIYENGGG
jgi:hypothetical protein